MRSGRPSARSRWSDEVRSRLTVLSSCAARATRGNYTRAGEAPPGALAVIPLSRKVALVFGAHGSKAARGARWIGAVSRLSSGARRMIGYADLKRRTATTLLDHDTASGAGRYRPSEDSPTVSPTAGTRCSTPFLVRGLA